jgi:uncharacterized protein YuzE
MAITKIALTLTVDSEADAGYIKTKSGDRSVSRTIPIHDDDDHLYGTIDLAEDGSLLGIELLGVHALLPTGGE